jgi:hypothetical protein
VTLENEPNGTPQPGLRFRVSGQNVAHRFAGRHLKIVQISFSHNMPLRHCLTGLVRMSNFIHQWGGVKDKVEVRTNSFNINAST